MRLLFAALVVLSLSTAQGLARGAVQTPRKPPPLRLASGDTQTSARLTRYCLKRTCVAVPHAASCPAPETAAPSPCGPTPPSLSVRPGDAVFIDTEWAAESLGVGLGRAERLLSYRAGPRRWAVRVPRDARRTVAASIEVRYHHGEVARWSVDLVAR